ncbi:hypothetical protein OY671_007653, partial [Metschnikowia pulcherrima]
MVAETADHKKAVFRRSIDCYARAAVDAMESSIAPSYSGHTSAGDRDWAGFRQRISNFHAIFDYAPDAFVIEDQFADGDKVATRMTARVRSRESGEAMTMIGINSAVIRRCSMSGPVLSSNIDLSSPEAQARAAHNRASARDLRDRVARTASGGDARSRERHVARGKSSPRDRVERSLDPGSPSSESSQLAAGGLYGDEVPGAGVITAIGRVSGRQCVIVANDATVKGGTYYPSTVKKHSRAQDIARQHEIGISGQPHDHAIGGQPAAVRGKQQRHDFASRISQRVPARAGSRDQARGFRQSAIDDEARITGEIECGRQAGQARKAGRPQPASRFLPREIGGDLVEFRVGHFDPREGRHVHQPVADHGLNVVGVKVGAVDQLGLVLAQPAAQHHRAGAFADMAESAFSSEQAAAAIGDEGFGAGGGGT